MQAGETKLQPMIEGTKQYVVPLFQRPYSWEPKEWRNLWADLRDLCELENPRPHFFGSIVTMPTVSVPEGVTKFLLIDGQQRLTTTFVLLAFIRNVAKTRGRAELAQEIEHTLLVNPFKAGTDYFKLQPTQDDRIAFQALMRGDPPTADSSRVVQAFSFFERQYRKEPLDIDKLKSVTCRSLSVVSIVLDPNDNPHLVFEGLNAKGKPLTQADLIRNYFVMRVHADQQEEVYNHYWRPMQEALGDSLTEFIRHFLMRKGAEVKVSDVYFALKDEVNTDNALPYIREVARFAGYYEKLLDPSQEADPDLQRSLTRLQQLDVGVSYPFLLRCYDDYVSGALLKQDFLGAIATIENFMIRRFVCNVPTYGLNKTFPPLYNQIRQQQPQPFLQAMHAALQTKSYPKDYEFEDRLKSGRLYGAGDRVIRTKLILQSLEESYGHKEQVDLAPLSVEHVMPQTLNDDWRTALGEDWQMTHDLYLHTLGNLTLTGYNPELSNDSFGKKQPLLEQSHLDLNSGFKNLATWGKDQIEKRANDLAARALDIWHYFGSTAPEEPPLQIIGTTPRCIWILGQRFDTESWRDVLRHTMNTIAELEPEKFEQLLKEFPTFIGRDQTKFRVARQLTNGAYIEVHMGALRIARFCAQAIEAIGLTTEDWRVETTQGAAAANA